MSISDADAPARLGLRRLFWRLHFWAGLIAAPLVLFAAGTGLLYVLTPQIEARVHAALDHVPVGRGAQPLDAQFAAAAAAFPALRPQAITPANAPGDTTQVLLVPPHGAAGEHAQHAAAAVPPQPSQPAPAAHGLPQGRIVYVDPSTAQVVGSLAEMERFRNWARKLHSSALQGDAWRWPIELAASWMLVLLATGLVLWWPRSQARGGPGWRALLPPLGPGQGRARWRWLHTSVGVVFSVLLAVVLVTGLTWSRQAGGQFRAAQQALGQAAPQPPTVLPARFGGAPGGHGDGSAGHRHGDDRSGSGPGDSTDGSGTDRRTADSTDGTAAHGVRPPASLQRLLDVARAERQARLGAAQPPLQLGWPVGPHGVWRVDTLVPGDPTQRLVLALAPATGEVLYRSGWADLPPLAKATAVGIPFHRAEFGVWNQVLIGATAVAAIVSVVSGVALWWRRGPAGRIAAPAVARDVWRVLPWWLWALTAALAVALPVFAISLAVFAAFELVDSAWRRPVAR